MIPTMRHMTARSVRQVRWCWRCMNPRCERRHARYRGETACANLRCACGGTAFVKATEQAPERREA